MSSSRESVSIRKALPSDFSKIVEIESLSFRRPYPPELIFSLLHLHSDMFYVALVDGEIVGYVVGAKRRDGSGHVISIAVRPEWRRRGIGAKLMEVLLNAFKDKGLKKAVLEVAISNEEAVNFYKRLGFKVVTLLKDYYSWGEDAYFMVKEI